MPLPDPSRPRILSVLISVCLGLLFGAVAEGGLGRRTLLGSFTPPAGRKIKVAFFDADWTLRVSKSGKPTSTTPDDVVLLPFVAQTIRRLNREGYFVAIVSNQYWVPKRLSREVADQALSRTVELLGQQGAVAQYYDYGEDNDADLKPSPVMGERLEALLKERFPSSGGIDWGNSLMVGDSAYQEASPGRPADIRPDGRPGTDRGNGDRLFAENLGVRFHEPADFFGWRVYGIDIFTQPAEVERFLLDHPCSGIGALDN